MVEQSNEMLFKCCRHEIKKSKIGSNSNNFKYKIANCHSTSSIFFLNVITTNDKLCNLLNMNHVIYLLFPIAGKSNKKI